MPRNRALRGTNAHPRDTGSFVPYLDTFCSFLQPSDCFTKTSELISSYMHYVFIRCGKTRGNDTSGFIRQAKSGFRRAFRTLAIQHGWKECTKPRGYYVKLPRITRGITNTNVANIGKIDNNILLERKFIDKTVGYGVFASCDIPKAQTVIEYRGQWISRVVNECREKYYSENGFAPVAVHDPKTGFVLDANTDENGKMFEPHENIARFFNHSKRSPNCKLISEINSEGFKKLFIETLAEIPKGEQLLWDYGDRNNLSIASNPWLSS